MIRILALPRFSTQGASSRYRIHSYVPYLQSQGFSVDVVPLLGNTYVPKAYHGKQPSYWSLSNAYFRRLAQLLRGRCYDLVWIGGESLPWVPGVIESLLLRMTPRYVLDFDDALFHRYDSHQSKIIQWGLGKKISRLMRHAAMVVAGNEYIAEYARHSGAGCVRNLPTVVDLTKYDLASHREKSPLNIGWIGTPFTARLLSSIHAALMDVCRDGSAQLTLVGAGGFHLDDVPFVVREWSEATEVAEIQQFDVGIMPLPANDPILRGKCGLKLIQYMACGVPAVGTPLGVNAEILQNNVTGFQATTNDEWVNALNAMKVSAAQRRRMGIAGRQLVESNYSFQAAAPRLADLLREAVETSPQTNVRKAA